MAEPYQFSRNMGKMQEILRIRLSHGLRSGLPGLGEEGILLRGPGNQSLTFKEAELMAVH